MSILQRDDLIEHLSRYNNQYYCTIEKVELRHGIIRVFIDQRGDNSLGPSQSPFYSSLASLDKNSVMEYKKPISGNFSVSDPNSQYLGYLDFALDPAYFTNQNIIEFQYGSDSYSTAKLFLFDQAFIDEHHLKPLQKSSATPKQ